MITPLLPSNAALNHSSSRLLGVVDATECKIPVHVKIKIIHFYRSTLTALPIVSSNYEVNIHIDLFSRRFVLTSLGITPLPNDLVRDSSRYTSPVSCIQQ